MARGGFISAERYSRADNKIADWPAGSIGGFILPWRIVIAWTIHFIHFVYDNHDLMARGGFISAERYSRADI